MDLGWLIAVAVVGVVVLVILALAVGAELDTWGQRRERRRLAEERRRRAEEGRRSPARRADGLCDECPYREDA